METASFHVLVCGMMMMVLVIGNSYCQDHFCLHCTVHVMFFGIKRNNDSLGKILFYYLYLLWHTWYVHVSPGTSIKTGSTLVLVPRLPWSLPLHPKSRVGFDILYPIFLSSFLDLFLSFLINLGSLLLFLLEWIWTESEQQRLSVTSPAWLLGWSIIDITDIIKLGFTFFTLSCFCHWSLSRSPPCHY